MPANLRAGVSAEQDGSAQNSGYTLDWVLRSSTVRVGVGLNRVQRLKDSVEHLPAELVMDEARSGRFAVEVCLMTSVPPVGPETTDRWTTTTITDCLQAAYLGIYLPR